MNSSTSVAAVLGLVLGACGGGEPPLPPPPAPAPPPPPVAAAPALHGAQLGDIDRTADPCTDFFQFANGAWRAANPIPPSQPKWSRRWEAGETNKERLKQLLDDLVAMRDAPHGSAEQIVGDFYGACTDEARADASGVAPLAPLFAELDAI
ncbi:MAG: M13 family peptidase, partial [Polyangiaceae bacterium]